MRQSTDVQRGRFAACLAVALSIAASQAAAQQVTIGPSLRAGDQFRLELVRLRENSQQSQQNGRSRTFVDVAVISVSADETVLDWEPGDTTLDNPQLAQNPLLAAAMRAASGLRFRLTLDTDGRLTGMVDVFNSLNHGTVVNFATTTGTNFKRVLGILDPRIVRFGVRYDF